MCVCVCVSRRETYITVPAVLDVAQEKEEVEEDAALCDEEPQHTPARVDSTQGECREGALSKRPSDHRDSLLRSIKTSLGVAYSKEC